MERFVKDPHTLRQESQGSLCPHIDEFAQHRKSLVAPVTPVERTTIDKLLDDFSLYLQQERVLAATTVANYVSLIKKFLTVSATIDLIVPEATANQRCYRAAANRKFARGGWRWVDDFTP